MSFLAESYIQKYGKVEKFLKGQTSIERYFKICPREEEEDDESNYFNEGDGITAQDQFGQSHMSGFGLGAMHDSKMSQSMRPKTNEVGSRPHMKIKMNNRSDVMTPEREKRAMKDLKECKTLQDTVSCAVSNRDVRSIISKNKANCECPE